MVGRSKPPVWHQVAYVSEVLGNLVFALELTIMPELGLFVLNKSVVAFGL